MIRFFFTNLKVTETSDYRILQVLCLNADDYRLKILRCKCMLVGVCIFILIIGSDNALNYYYIISGYDKD